MLKEEKLDVLVVTTVDYTHDMYIVPALKAGVRVLTEKPMTTCVSYRCICMQLNGRNVEKCRRILDTVKETNGSLQGAPVSNALRPSAFSRPIHTPQSPRVCATPL
jgi:DNA-binding NarL/FixJ family response regulator